MKKTLAFAAMTLLLAMAVSAEVVRTYGLAEDRLKRADYQAGGEYSLDKNTGTRKRFRGGALNNYGYRPNELQEGRFYTEAETRPNIGGKYYASVTGLISGDLGTYHVGSDLKDPADVEFRSFRNRKQFIDEDYPWRWIRDSFRKSGWTVKE